MVNRVCISINNRCNLSCKYCHFHEKKEAIQEEEMDVIAILDNITKYIDSNDIDVFKIGFVGNGEPLLEYEALKDYILHISEYLADGRIAAYSITNGLLVDESKLEFFKEHKVNLGFSIDGVSSIHNMYRCNTYAKVMEKIELYRRVNGKYPSMNCTVGKEVLEKADDTISFFRQFDTRVTFSRMIGKYGIALSEFNDFLKKASQVLNVRTGGYDCTMYGGLCGAGMNNFFYANGEIYFCGNCVDLPALGMSNMPISELENISLTFDRTHCYKETICE
ncbi:MAG: radical SAM protein [Eubacterium sp.]|nr:radical SAM protein [Eubacterium sp.]